LSADGAPAWLAGGAGAAFALPLAGGLFRVFVTGRDASNRSSIGFFDFNVDGPRGPAALAAEPLLSRGLPGAFDDSGVSYPWIAQDDGKFFLYYVGWSVAARSGFQNHLGLAADAGDGTFGRISRAPILERTDAEPFGTGSACVLKEAQGWRMWYTCFTSWGEPGAEGPKHRYLIKEAFSSDGTVWRRPGRVAIDFASPDEYAICRPSVIRAAGRYHMWFTVRGENYRIAHAHSHDGSAWVRSGSLGLDPAGSGWESREACYSHVFAHGETLYMLYNGNGYGREGLGLASMPLSALRAFAS
jgi:hypothetical protein